MKYYSVPDQCFTAINREIDNTRLLIADDSWKDTNISGILTFVTCRKLKSNVLRIYDPTTTRLLFELEFYEGMQDTAVCGKRFLMIPFKQYCFCFLFENLEDSDCSMSKIKEMSSLYKSVIPKEEESHPVKKSKSSRSYVISGVTSVQIVNHEDHEVVIEGDKIYDMLYKDKINQVAIKKRSYDPSLYQQPSLPPSLPSLPQQPPSLPPLPQQPQQHPEPDERETLRKQIEQHHFTSNLISEDNDELLPVVPPIPTPSEISQMRPSDIISKNNTQPVTKHPPTLTMNEYPTNGRPGESSIGSMEVDSLTLEKQQLRENISEQYLMELMNQNEDLLRDLDLSTGSSFSRGVSDVSDNSQVVTMTNYINQSQRGKGMYDDCDDDYNNNVEVLRQYQRQNSQWGTAIIDTPETTSNHKDGNVYVIDDADMCLREEDDSISEGFRPSSGTVILNNRVSSIAPTLPRHHTVVRSSIQYPSCSKESMMIMRDLDNLAELSEESNYYSEETVSTQRASPCNTVILPSVLSHSSYQNSLKSNDSAESPQRPTVKPSRPINNPLPPHISYYQRS